MQRIISRIIENPYQVFWGALPFVAIIGWVITQHSIDLQIHDTYFVIVVGTIAICAGVWFSIVGLLYYLFRDRKLRKWMTRLHVVCSILVFLILVILADPQGAGPLDFTDYEKGRQIMGVAIGSLLAFMIAQILFFLNLIQSLWRK